MKRKIIMSFLWAAPVALVCLCPILAGKAVAKSPEGHPELSEQEQLIACSQCHQTETPDIYEEWYNSRHGIGMVKCYQCHGTFEDLKAVPERSTCGFCHDAALGKCPADTPCWQCHPAHTFELKK